MRGTNDRTVPEHARHESAARLRVVKSVSAAALWYNIYVENSGIAVCADGASVRTAPAALGIQGRKHMNKTELAESYHRQGCNCAQAVACAFADQVGADPVELFRMTEAFGFGMGTMGTCGALSGAAAIVGLTESDGNFERPESKKRSYRAIKQLTHAFDERVGSHICAEIRGMTGGRVLHSCEDCVRDAADIVEEYLAARGDRDRSE